MKHLYKLIVWLLMAVAAPVAGFAQGNLVDTIACESYTWYGSVYTESGTHFHFSADSTVVDTLHLTVNYGTYRAFSKDTCGGFVWHGSSYGSSGVYTYPYTNDHNCPSVDTLYLTVNPTYNVTERRTICASELPYTWNHVTFNTAGTQTDTLSTVNHCDSIVTMVLTVNTPVHEAITRSECESYEWNDSLYTQSGDHIHPHPDANGCPQVDTLHLTIYNPIHTATHVTACESFTWHGATYTTSATYTYAHQDDHGCWQVDTLHLTINNPVHTAVTETACESYEWNGQTYTVSGDYEQIFTAANTCDSIVTLHLTIHNGTHTADRASACERYHWHDSIYCSTGTYVDPYMNADGCESADTLHLTIYIPTHGSLTVSATGSYAWDDGQNYTSSGTYLYPHPDVHGCMQVDTLHLTIIPLSDEIIDTAVCASALPYMWHDLPFYTTGNYTYSYQNASGNLVVAQLNLTVNPLPNVTISGESAFCFGGSTTLTADGATTYTWGNETTAELTVTEAGVYMVTGTDSNGCANTASVEVVMNVLPTVTISGETAFCLGGSTTLTASGATTYAWGNETTAALTVTEAGTYTVTGTDANNCVNTASVEVTVNALPTVTINGDNAFCAGASTNLTASGAMTYIWNTSESAGEITVSHAGSYSVVGTDGNGCANTASVEVTENPVYHLSIEAAICANDLPYHYVNGQVDTTFMEGTPGFSTVNFYLSTSRGCDSTITLALTVYPSPVPFITGDMQFCPGDGTFLTASGGVVYAWSTGETANQIYVVEGDVYTVTVTDSHECTASADVVVEEIPSELVQKNVVSKNHADGTPYMLVYPQAGLLYQWYKSGERLDGETRQYYIPSDGLEANILYTVQVRPQIPDGCGIRADWSWDGTRTGRVSIVPNPNDGHFTLLLPAPAVSVSVYSATGEVVLQKELSGSDRVNVNSGLANGLYLLKIVQEEGTIITEKLIINK